MHQATDMDQHSAELALREAYASGQHQRAHGMGRKTGGEMTYVYHYHAQIQNSYSTLTNIDGIALLEYPVDSMDVYEKIKKAIANKDKYDYEKLTICSLSLIHTKVNNDGL